MTEFFFDRNFGTQVPLALRTKCGTRAVFYFHEEQYPRQAPPDDVWLSDVGRKQWFVLTKDRKLHKRENEHLAWLQHRVGCFYLCCNGMNVEDEVKFVNDVLNKMLQVTRSVSRPFVIRIHREQRIEIVALGDDVDSAVAASAPEWERHS